MKYVGTSPYGDSQGSNPSLSSFIMRGGGISRRLKRKLQYVWQFGKVNFAFAHSNIPPSIKRMKEAQPNEMLTMPGVNPGPRSYHA